MVGQNVVVLCGYFLCLAAKLLVSKFITDNTLLLDKLSKYLDRESRAIKCWKHLAYIVGVPTEETRKFDVFTERSPTEDLFNYLLTWNPDLTVGDLKEVLKAAYRNDVIESLEKGTFPVNVLRTSTGERLT